MYKKYSINVVKTTYLMTTQANSWYKLYLAGLKLTEKWLHDLNTMTWYEKVTFITKCRFKNINHNLPCQDCNKPKIIEQKQKQKKKKKKEKIKWKGKKGKKVLYMNSRIIGSEFGLIMLLLV